MSEIYHIFIGYDEREDFCFKVAKHSILKHATVPVIIHAVNHRELRERGLFTRDWLIDEKGQYFCNVDKKPFSTQFSHSRFLVPELFKLVKTENSSPLVGFVDCDFLFQCDVKEIFREIKNQKDKAVFVVKHEYRPNQKIKMDNMVQIRYNKKLWSAFMFFNLEHPANKVLNEKTVNSQSGQFLHNFGWLNNDDLIGSFSRKYHYVVNHSTGDSEVVHFTEGGPWFKGFENCEFAEEWNVCAKDYLNSASLDDIVQAPTLTNYL